MLKCAASTCVGVTGVGIAGVPIVGVGITGVEIAVCTQCLSHVACRNAQPPAIGVILHEERRSANCSSRQDKNTVNA